LATSRAHYFLKDQKPTAKFKRRRARQEGLGVYFTATLSPTRLQC
jgi:hypothetical protein